MWKIQQAMQDDAIRTARKFIPPFIPVTGMKCSYGKISSPLSEISVGKSEISETGPARSTGLIWRGPNRLEHGLHIGIHLGVPLNGQPKWHLKHFFDCLTCTFHVPYITGVNLGLVIFYHCSDSCLYILKVSIFLKEWLCEKGHTDCFRVIQRSQA